MPIETIVKLLPVLLPIITGCFDSDNRAAFEERLADTDDCKRLLRIGCRMAKRKLNDSQLMGSDAAATFAALDALEAELGA